MILWRTPACLKKFANVNGRSLQNAGDRRIQGEKLPYVLPPSANVVAGPATLLAQHTSAMHDASNPAGDQWTLDSGLTAGGHHW
jgi:hypothetical protein